MHAEEVPTDPDLVRRMLADQFPGWVGLPVRRVASYGTDHAIYRLGEHLAVRMPRIAWATGQAAVERTWLPRLAPRLPVDVPEHVGAGAPGAGYPYEWSVVTWLPGRPAGAEDRSSDALADDLAGFVTTLRSVAAPDAPAQGPRQRGGVLAEHDTAVRGAVSELGERVETTAILRAWEEALSAGSADTQVLSHGDLLPGNLLLQDGRLRAVIDWGGFGSAAPALDLLPAWNVLDGVRRARLRAALHVDDATWARSRGWALQQALLALPYYWETNPPMVAQASYALEQVLTR